MSVNVVSPSTGALSKIATRGQYIQFSVMPTANADRLNQIVQYTGTTTSNYTNGYFYKCEEVSTGVYGWTNINVQAGGSGGGAVDSVNGKTGTVVLDAKDIGLQYDTMPTASATYENQIVQYTGTTDSNYTNGYFYKCVEDGGVYSWVLVADFALASDVYTKTQVGALTDLPDTSKNIVQNIDAINTAVGDKADKVSSATNGDIATLDSNGNLTDSGILATNVIVKSNTTGLIKNDGTIDESDYLTSADIADKADIVENATADDFATLDASGNLTDSGINKNIVPSGASSSNKLATANDIPDEISDLDDVEVTNPVNAQILAYNSTSGKWENQTGQAAIGGAVFKGSINFANLPTTGMVNGDWYDIKDSFTTDNRFEEGSGIACAAGTDVIWVDSDSKWNILTPSGVFSFNGRTGAVSPASGDYSASGVTYSNTTSGLTADDVQEAIDEVNTNVSGKANKVSGATNGNFAGLDSNGNLTDSGSKASDFSTVKSRQTPASGGTTLSLVNTGDMYNWDNKVDSVSVGSMGTASGSTVAYQRIGVGDASGSVTYTEIDGTKYMELTTPSSSSGGVTSFVFTNNVITHTALYDIYSNVYGVAPTNVVAPSDGTTHTLTVNFNSSTGVTACRVYIRG